MIDVEISKRYQAARVADVRHARGSTSPVAARSRSTEVPRKKAHAIQCYERADQPCAQPFRYVRIGFQPVCPAVLPECRGRDIAVEPFHLSKAIVPLGYSKPSLRLMCQALLFIQIARLVRSARTLGGLEAIERQDKSPRFSP